MVAIYIILFAFIRASNAYFIGDGTAYTLGSIGSGNCNMMHSGYSKASTNYAAINNEQWDGLYNCGRCVSVKCADSRCTNTETAIVQILDRCPECKYGDLDLSPIIFKQLTGSDPSRYRVQWEFVDCPISGKLKYCFNSGANNYWVAIQPSNYKTGIKQLRINGKDTTIMQHAYYFLLETSWIDIGNVEIEIVDMAGQIIKERVALKAGECTESAYQFDVSAIEETTDTEEIVYCD